MNNLYSFAPQFRMDGPGRNPSPTFDDVQAPWPAVPIEIVVGGQRAALTIEGGCVLPSEERYEHCAAAMKAGFPVLVGPGNHVSNKPCVLVGSGPSAIPLLPEIRARYDRGEEIIAVKGAHDWLLSHGIKPVAAIALDPQQSRAKCFGNPQPDVLYLCASQMHPDTWAHLRGLRVLIWHSRIGATQHLRPGWDRTYLIPCACTTGNSGIFLLYLLGRRNFELYGFDSSLPEPASRWERIVASVRGRLMKLDGARVPRDQRVVRVAVGQEIFSTTAGLVQQATEIGALLQSLPDIKVNAHGRGYFQAILAEGKRLGWPV